jgi:hypothetical protein
MPSIPNEFSITSHSSPFHTILPPVSSTVMSSARRSWEPTCHLTCHFRAYEHLPAHLLSLCPSLPPISRTFTHHPGVKSSIDCPGCSTTCASSNLPSPSCVPSPVQRQMSIVLACILQARINGVKARACPCETRVYLLLFVERFAEWTLVPRASERGQKQTRPWQPLRLRYASAVLRSPFAIKSSTKA